MSVDFSSLYRHIDNRMAEVHRTMDHVAQAVASVSGQVENVSQQQEITKQEIKQLGDEFQAFLAADLRQKERQFAATRVIEVRQALEKQFGHNDEVRRTATGLLQATDAALVRAETMRTAGEELMISCPGYWLAPALVALTSWIQDNVALAEKCLAEALRRDDSKASLLFALVCRRARRMEACALWLMRYFETQTPAALDREAVVMLDAMANGVFGGAALTMCSGVIERWMNELEQQAGFSDEQRKRWAETLDVLAPKATPDEYPTLRKFSPTWPALETALVAARRNRVVLSFFEKLFTGEIEVPPKLEEAVDALLESLVTNFDDAELPLRREERLLELIVEEEGDKQAAVRRFDSESQALEEQTDFAAMMTNVAMYPERFGGTPATQRYAASRCRSWIIAGHQDLVARDRAQTPTDVELNCGSATCSSKNGSNETPLVEEVSQHYAKRIEQAIAAVKITSPTWAGVAIGGVIGLLVAINGAALIGLVIMAGAGAYLYFQYKGLEASRQRVRDALAKERADALSILRAGLAELVDLRREIAQEDGRADAVTDFLSSLSTPQFVLKRPEQARAILGSEA
jgi:hypothetical protein